VNRPSSSLCRRGWKQLQPQKCGFNITGIKGGIGMKRKNARGIKSTSKKITESPAFPGIKKQYLKSFHECRITFRLPGKAAPESKKVTVVGDFNNWNTTELPMKRLKNGDYKLVLKLHGKREYRFRYLIDDIRWENDWHADKYIPNPYGCDDSVVVV
jgi:hypothetical protein